MYSLLPTFGRVASFFVITTIVPVHLGQSMTPLGCFLVRDIIFINFVTIMINQPQNKKSEKFINFIFLKVVSVIRDAFDQSFYTIIQYYVSNL